MGDNNIIQGGHDELTHILGATPIINVGQEYAEYAYTDANGSPVHECLKVTDNTHMTVTDNG